LDKAPPNLNGILGLVLEVPDLAAARAFYEDIFGSTRGEWVETRQRLVFQSGGQRLEFVRSRHPRTIAHAGYHVGLRVATGDYRAITNALLQSGHTVDWWREDHPAEREPTAYLSDPGGNIVQLVKSDEGGLIDHAGIPVESIEDAEVFYTRALGGQLNGYFGWTTEDVMVGRAWAAGDDPCAPWTRNAYVSFRTHKPTPSPAAQIYSGFGNEYVAIYLTGQRLPEPPEEQLKGAPRLILHAAQTADEVAQRLTEVRATAVRLTYDGGKVPFEREAQDLFLRDRCGNFLQIACEG
jgi:catechol 2,3-dioxygenase-like lactoylglutathione lyase family enzyme